MIHLFPLLKMELCCMFLHHKITQNVDFCLLFQEQVLGLHHRSTAAGHVLCGCGWQCHMWEWSWRHILHPGRASHASIC